MDFLFFFCRCVFSSISEFGLRSLWIFNGLIIVGILIVVIGNFYVVFNGVYVISYVIGYIICDVIIYGCILKWWIW